MKALYLNNTSFLANGGGGENRADEITKRLAADDHEVTVLVGKTAPNLSKWERDHERRFRHVTCIPEFAFAHESISYYLSRYLFAFTSLPVLIWLLWREDFDVIVETMTPHPTFAVLVAKAFDVPIVATRHEFFDHSCYEVYGPLTATIQLVVQNFLRIFEYEQLVVPTDHVKREAVTYGVPEERVTVIPNGVDADRYHRPETDTEEGHLIVVGRLTKRKRQSRLIRAVRDLRNDGYDLHLHIVGEGPTRNQLEGLIDQFDLKESITLHGFVSEERKLELLNRAELFVFASTQEGFGMVLLEAMAAKLPVVATELPVYDAFFDHGENGALIAADGSGSFAAAIQSLVNDADHLEEIGEKNFETAVQFSWETVANQTELILLDATTNSDFTGASSERTQHESAS